jgi:hypothetical protein
MRLHCSSNSDRSERVHAGRSAAGTWMVGPPSEWSQRPEVSLPASEPERLPTDEGAANPPSPVDQGLSTGGVDGSGECSFLPALRDDHAGASLDHDGEGCTVLGNFRCSRRPAVPVTSLRGGAANGEPATPCLALRHQPVCSVGGGVDRPPVGPVPSLTREDSETSDGNRRNGEAYERYR